MDPLAPEYPELTPYQFASNTPIESIDLDGLERFNATHSSSAGGEINLGIAKWFYKKFQPDRSPQEADLVTGDKLGPMMFLTVVKPANSFANSLDIEFWENSNIPADGPITNAVRHGYGQALATNKFGIYTAKKYADVHEYNADGDKIIDSETYPHIWIDGIANENLSARHALNMNLMTFVPSGMGDSFVDQLNNETARGIGSNMDKDALQVGILQAVLDGKFYGAYTNHPLAPVGENGEKLSIIAPVTVSHEERGRIESIISSIKNGSSIEQWEEGRKAAKNQTRRPNDWNKNK